MGEGATVRYTFDEFELNVDEMRLRCGGVDVAMQPQEFDVLKYLIEHRDRVVSKTELMDAVWGDRFVSESAVSSRIKTVRRMLGDDGSRQRIVRTVHGRGFQFMADTVEHRHVVAAPKLARLTLPTSAFVGRDDDLVEIGDLLAHRRLVTIWGPGGVGKSRLALHVAARCAGDHGDGVYLVELGAVSADDDVVARICADLGVNVPSGVEPLDRLVDAFASQCALVLLDNCEHVLDSVRPVVVGLLQRTARVAVLTTSRHPLGVDDEQLWHLSPLGLLATQDGGVAPAVELLTERIRSGDPSFELTDANEREVWSICRQLDGVPLLLEIAAARVRHVGLRGVLEDIVDPVSLENPAMRSPRHRSADDVIRWSFDLLEPADQNVFLALSAFVGWFEREGALAVAGLEAPSALWRLADHSLLTVDNAGDTTRYRLLEPLRSFALRERQRRGHDRRLVRRHADYVLGALVAADTRLRSPGGAAAMAQIEALDGDARFAYGTLAAGDCVAEVGVLARALFVFAQERMRADWHRSFEEAIDGSCDDVVVAAAAAVGAWQRGDLTRAQSLVERAGRADVGADADRALVELVRGQVLQLLGRSSEAVAAGERVIRATRGIDPLLEVMGWSICALNSMVAGDMGAARDAAGRLAAVARTCESQLALAWSAYVDGELALDDQSTVALECLTTAGARAVDAGSSLLSGVARLSSVSLRCRSNDHGEVPLTEYAGLIRHWSMAGMWAHQWATLRNLVVSLGAAGRSRDAAVLLGAVKGPSTDLDAFGAEAERLARTIDDARRRLGDGEFEELVHSGARLTPQETVVLAMDLVRSPPGG